MILSNSDDTRGTNAGEQAKPQIIVVGAGSAGFSAAITAAGAGAEVTLVGEGTIGGTCVNIGCVPSKTMIRAVETLYQSRHASRFEGIASSANILDWNALVRQKQKLVDDLRQAKYIDVLPSYEGINYVEGRAHLEEDGLTIDGRLYSPDKIIIATGSSNAIPPIKGIDSVQVLDSTSALELETLPKSMIVIGAGVIGCELAQMFARAGVQVTICCRSRLVPEMEPEISEHLQRYFEAEGITVLSGIDYQNIEQDGDLIRLEYGQDGESKTIAAEKLMVAAGRSPNTQGMGLEAVGVKLSANGGIEVDNDMRSTNPVIFAAGDVTGGDMFVYMAAYGAKLAALNAINGGGEQYNNEAMPEVIFTDPQCAKVGLSEAGARDRGFDVKTSVITLDHVPRYLAARDTRGLIKLVADKQSDKLLGAHILAPEGGEIIQSAVMAIKAGMTTKELGQTIFPYLTGVEGLKLAAQTFDKDVSTLSCCAG
jgi:mercuric reductase